MVDILPDSTAAQQVKKAVLELAIERANNALEVAKANEANALFADVDSALLQSAELFIAPNPDASNLWGFGTMRSPDYNPYLDGLVASAENSLASEDSPFPQVTVERAVYKGLGGTYGARSAPATARNFFWLFAHEQSPMRFNPELIKRSLRRMHTFADTLNLDPLRKLGGDHNVWFDQFAMENIFPAFYEIAELHPGLLLPSQRAIWDNMMQAVRSSVARGNEHAWRGTWNYNIETARSLAVLNVGLYLDDQEIVSRVLEKADGAIRMQRPDGAMPYHGDDRPSVNYHNVLMELWHQIYEQTGHEPLRIALEKSQWKGPTTGLTEEWWTSPIDKALRWNTAQGAEAGIEPVAAFTQNPYVRWQIDRNQNLAGGASGKINNSRGAAMWYDANTASQPLPDNYTIPDKNIGGPRTWTGEFTYAGAYRPWHQGYTTLVGAMTVDPDTGRNNSMLTNVMPQVWVTPEDEGGLRQYARNTHDEVSASIIAKNYNIGTVLHGLKRAASPDNGSLSDWQARQVWVGLSDRLVGLVSTVPGVENAKGYAVQTVLRFMSRGTQGAQTLKELETISPTHYRYGQLDIIVHENTYTSVTGILTPYRLSGWPATELTFSDRPSEPADAGSQKTYPSDANYRFVIEIRPTWADPNTLTRVDLLGDQHLIGLEVVGNERSVQVWLNADDEDRMATLQRDRLPAGRASVAVSEGLMGRPAFQANVPAQTQLAPGQHAVVVVSDNPEDHDNGWNAFSDLAGYPEVQVSGETRFDRVGVNATKEHTFTLTNDNSTTLLLTGSPAIEIEGDSAFSLVQDVQQSSLVDGQATTFSVRFAPPAPGKYAATLKIATNIPGNENHHIHLTGVGSNEIKQIQPSPWATSWENPVIWENNLPAEPGGQYVVQRSDSVNPIFRTPLADSTFPGEQLRFTDGGYALMKLADEGSISVNRTVFDGGGIVFGTAGLTHTWEGEVHIGQNGIFVHNTGKLIFTGPVKGDGPITADGIQASFDSGDWGGDLSIAGDDASVRFGFDIANGRSLTYNKGTFDIDGRDHRFLNVFIDGTPLPAGTYTADDLGDGFTGEGTITVAPYQRQW